jgi:signal transduction histidine kinase
MLLWGTRARVLVGFIVLLALSTVASLLLVRQILLVRLEDEISSELAQETQEFRRLAAGIDPRTGEPFGTDLKAIYDVYFSRNVPDEGEALIALLEGRIYKTNHAHDASYEFERRPGLLRHLGRLERSERGTIMSPAGEARYLAIPVATPDPGAPEGTFVVLNFPASERAEVNTAVRVATVVSGVVFVLGSVFAWAIAGRVLSPLRLLDDAARSITESDLTRRIPVRGRDELAQLTRRFNDMIDRLEASFALQRQFTNDAGHELRTPITIIRGHLELLDDDPRERRKTIVLVMDELDRMSRMVDELLLLARAEQPDFLHLGRVDIAELTAQLHTKAQALGRRRWRLENVGEGVIYADGQRLTQAMMQLAHNATRHTVEGDLIRLGSALTNGSARFWIGDSGPGIAPEDQERIFTRFARAPQPQRSEGAGLGLAIVRAIAEAHGGRVELRSQPGAGATFTVVVPIHRPASIPKRPAPA